MPQSSYNYIYLPNHPRAHTDGCVYEHILKAEEKLGRQLSKKEVVHHIDRNRKNNDVDNLMVFATSSDHISFHRGNEAVLEGDVYKCKKLIYYCKTCQKETHNKHYCCMECFRFSQRICVGPTKENLEELVNKFSILHVSRLFNVSDNAIRKWCYAYDIPFKTRKPNYKT